MKKDGVFLSSSATCRFDNRSNPHPLGYLREPAAWSLARGKALAGGGIAAMVAGGREGPLQPPGHDDVRGMERPAGKQTPQWLIHCCLDVAIFFVWHIASW